VGDDVAFVGDAEFGPHLFGLLGLRGIKVTVRFGAERVPGQDRFELSAHAREMMVEMYEGLAAREQVAAVKGAEDLLDGPVDGFGAVYGDGRVRG
jgi:hypothetical protein